MEKLDTIAIVGMGLIGGSLGRALVRNDLAKRVIGVDVDESVCREALELNAATETTTSLELGTKDADLIVFGVPVGMVADLVACAAKVNTRAALITDMGSSKAQIIDSLKLRPLANGCRFIGGHPIAGKETSGIGASDPFLFDGRAVVLTTFEPIPQQEIIRYGSSNKGKMTPAAIRKIMRPVDLMSEDSQYASKLAKLQEERMELKLHDFSILYKVWESVGAHIFQLTPEEHDRIVAQTSHLPHVLSTALLKQFEPSRVQTAGTGFRSVGRLAGGNVSIWKDILLSNSSNIVAELDHYFHILLTIRGILDRKDATALEEYLTETNVKYHDYFD